MGFLAILNAYTMRVCLSQAITVMVIKKNSTDDGEDNAICEPDDLDSGSTVRRIYQWSISVLNSV